MASDNNKVTQLNKGLNTDYSPQVQPEGTYRFALNSVNETELGDSLFLSNEEGNAISANLPVGYIPIGKKYIGNGDTVIFLVNKEETISEIGIFNEEGTYTTIVNDTVFYSEIEEQFGIQKLNFKLSHQIDCTYRLRRGCERTIYFTDDYNPPRYFNIDKAYNFKTTVHVGGQDFQIWDASLFKLFKTFSKIPIFSKLDIVEGGNLPSGSYNIAIQYVDSDLNPTEWITVTDTILLYNDSEDKNFSEIRGSTNAINSYQDFGPTRKAIKVTLSNLDEEFPYYRLALIEASNGSGNISKISATQEIPTKITDYILSGNNTVSSVTEEEIMTFGNSVDRVSHIEQLENRLLLSNVKSKNIQWHKLQKYASKIKTDLILSNVVLNKISNGNPKSGLVNIDKVGYMPGEIYSLGIVWVFEDGTTSPVFHIPGKNPSVGDSKIYSVGVPGIKPMKSTNNTCQTSTYTSLGSKCSSQDFWGLDCEGMPLVDSPIRHHRFPLRSEINEPLISKIDILGVNLITTTNIYGLRFSGIELPNIIETNGYKVIGYYIVRNERTETHKTILDTGVLTPVIKDSEDRFISHGILMPNMADNQYIKEDVVGLINPEFKFNGKEYKNFSLIQEGYFSMNNPATDKILTQKITQDVQPGTSYDPEISPRRDKDSDGFDLHTVSRNNKLKYTRIAKKDFATASDINEVFYLNAVATKNISDSDGASFQMYNVACDNKIGIISMNKKVDNVDNVSKKLPYVVLKNNLTEFYPTFRTLPYYPETQLKTENVCEVFNGDSYITPMKYTNSVFYDIMIAKRPTKSGTWAIILGCIVAVAAITATIVTLGAAAPLAVAAISGIVGAGLLVTGAGVTLAATGIETEVMSKTYNEAYEEGLKNTVGDDDINSATYFGPRNAPTQQAEPDDEVQWFTDTLSDIWFESSVNCSLRMGTTLGITDFLNPLSTVTAETLNSYALDKLTVIDTERGSGRLYKGYAGGELYMINKDYMRRDRQKMFFSLGLQYDCCSTCNEKFPHRVMYSEQSFQEELIDNYRVFLPNNYRDLDGETGEITNMFKIQNSLFIHTSEGLWNMPKNYQERVTNQIVSFLGTGSYFEIPPQKIVDDESGNSAGTIHKWGAIKTQHGYFFPCEKQNCIYMFNGKDLKPITDNGIKNDIYYKIPFKVDSQTLNGYSHNNNPSSPIGIGFISTYDSKKERIIFTKKDFILSSEILNSGNNSNDFELALYNGNIIFFPDYKANISEKESEGFIYYGIYNDKMRFIRYPEFSNIPEVFEILGEVQNDIVIANNSWTLSYSLKTQSWVSWHSYLPFMYLHTSQNFFSLKEGDSHIWKHNIFGLYQKFYNEIKPFIIEYVSTGDSLQNKTWENIMILLEAKKYDLVNKEFVDVDNIFFNKAIFYNSKQTSGEVDIKLKNLDYLDIDYISNQVTNENMNSIIVDRNEKNWTMNNLRDFRKDFTKSIFISDILSLQNEYFIDKIVNTSSIDYNKDWTDIESFRDKYLVVRLIFDTFADTKLLMNYSIENQNPSLR